MKRELYEKLIDVFRFTWTFEKCVVKFKAVVHYPFLYELFQSIVE